MSVGSKRRLPEIVPTGKTVSTRYACFVNAHRLAEERSLAYHRLVAARIASDPTILARARRQVQEWLERGTAPYYARQWDRILRGSIDDIRALLVADTEEGRALRQSTPFAGVIDPRERWRIWKETRDRGTRP
jgi:hypothetical protein